MDVKAVVRQAAMTTAKEAEAFGDAFHNGTWRSWLLGFVKRQCWAWAIAGSLAIGLTLPVLLVIWNCGGAIDGSWDSTGAQSQNALRAAAQSLMLLWIALIACGPLTILFALGVYAWLRRHAEAADATLLGIAKRGAWGAGLMAFMNAPGYLAGALMPEHGAPIWVRLPLLFVVAGVSCGLWIAWHAWRATRPEEPLLPRYSLSWLLGLVIAWGAVMAVFAPKA